MRLKHIHQLNTLYKNYGSENYPGSFGVTGIRWLFSTKKSTKAMSLDIHPGSFGGHMGQNSIFTKNAISPSDNMVWLCDS